MSIRKIFFGALLSVAAFAAMSMSSAQSAYADRPYDLSDVFQGSFIEWPFEVSSFEAVGESYTTKHNVRFAVPYQEVLAWFQNAIKKNVKVGKFFVMGVTETPNRDGFQLILALNNEHHFIDITSDGAGTIAVVQAMPSSYISGTFDPACFGFRMPDGGTIPIGKYREDGL